jgi:hypothetical protein
MPSGAAGIKLDIEHALGDDAAVARAGDAGILDGVLQIENDARVYAGIALVDQYGAATEQVPIALQREINTGVKQGMAGAYKSSQRLALGIDERLLKGNALITRKHGLSDADEAVTIADQRRNMRDFVTAGLALLDCSSEPLKSFKKE